VVVLAAVVALAGCSDDDGDAAERDASKVESSTTTTERPSTTTTSPACPPVAPSNDAAVAQHEGDVDDDGQDDLVQSFPDGEHVTLLVGLAAGGGATAEVPASEGASVELVGVAPIGEPDGAREVLWVRVGSGAATTILGLYHLDGCRLEAAAFEDGTPVQLPVGGTVGTTSGATCGSGSDPEADLLVHEGTYVSETEYEVRTTEYRWEDGVLVESPTTEPTVTTTDDVSEAAGFRCGDLSL
jgi:hypothetical protein